MFDKPRNWKWMVPAGCIPLLLVAWGSMDGNGDWARYAVIPLGLAVVASVAALMNGILYAWHYAAQIYGDVRAVLNSTPEVRMFEAAKSMHPDTAKALLVHRRTIWRQKYIPVKELVDYILDEAPIVHLGFVDFVLTNSNMTAIMSKRMLSDGSKQFDPTDIVTDYEQYDALLLLLQNKLMLTEAFGNQAGQWIPPWNPVTVGHRFGMDESFSADPEEVAETVKTVVRAQAASNGSNVPKSLSVLDKLPRAEQARVKVEPKSHPTPELTDEEEDAIRREMEAYGQKYVDGKVPS